MLIDKPEDTYCGQILKSIRRITGRKKIGHGGTLDPLASGLLIAGIDAGTRVLGYLTDLEKEYSCEAQLGTVTETDDITGKILKTHKGAFPDRAQVASALSDFMGDLEQVPPNYSALRVKGKRAYDLARKGERFELPSRTVHVKSIDFTGWDPENHRLTFRIFCSKGTYIRSIVRDLGNQLGCGGCVRKLRRLRIGDLPVEKAHDPSSFINSEKVEKALLSINRALYFLEAVRIDEESLSLLRNGQACELAHEHDTSSLNIVKGVTEEGRVFALLNTVRENGTVKYRVKRMIEH